MEIAIARGLIDRLLAEAAATPAREVCGLLFGDAGSIVDAQAAANVSPYPASAFEIDPAALFAALRRERTGGAAIVGHYHSHPNGLAMPSARDAVAAGRPGHLWLILGGGAAGLWRERPGGPIEGAFEPLSMRIDD